MKTKIGSEIGSKMTSQMGSEIGRSTSIPGLQLLVVKMTTFIRITL
jgi:hypothetical protein